MGYCMNPRWQCVEWESSDSCDEGLMNTNDFFSLTESTHHYTQQSIFIATVGRQKMFTLLTKLPYFICALYIKIGC